MVTEASTRGNQVPMPDQRWQSHRRRPLTGLGTLSHRVAPNARTGTRIHSGQIAPTRQGSRLQHRDIRSSCGTPHGPRPIHATSMARIWPVGSPANMASGPRHSVAAMNRVRPSGPPSAQEKHPRSTLIVRSTSPPSRMRTHRALGTSPTRPHLRHRRRSHPAHRLQDRPKPGGS